MAHYWLRVLYEEERKFRNKMLIENPENQNIPVLRIQLIFSPVFHIFRHTESGSLALRPLKTTIWINLLRAEMP